MNNVPKTIKVFDVDWDSETAGPSEIGTRTEIFLSGCKKARSGNPCKNCFNQIIWKEVEKDTDIKELVELVCKHSRSRNVTIVGGEPTDQLQELIRLCVELKALDFHIIVFTYKKLEDLLSEDNPDRESYITLLSAIDILIDGEYEEENRIFDDKNNKIAYQLIGSSNQMVWHCHHDNSFSFLQLRGNKAGDFSKTVPIKNQSILCKRKTFLRQEIYPFYFTVEDLYDFYHKVFANRKGDEKFWMQIQR